METKSNEQLQQQIAQLQHQLNRYKQLEKSVSTAGEDNQSIENANSIIMRMDPEGHITSFNNYAENFFGFKESEIIGRKLAGSIVPLTDTTGKDLQKMVDQITTSPERFINNINENCTKDGRKVWVIWTNKPIYDNEGRLVEILSIGNDFTKYKLAEDALRESEKKFRRIFQNIQDVYFEITPHGEFIELSPSVQEMFGYKRKELLNLSFSELLVDKAQWDALHRRLETSGVLTDQELLLQTTEGKPIHCSINSKLDIDESDNVKIIGSIRNITKRKQAQEKIMFMAYHDVLTGLYNRKGFVEQMKKHLTAARTAEEQCALLFIDLDNFKKVNDTNSHEIGDLLLREVAERLRSVLRNDDLICRFGGDEFMIMVTGKEQCKPETVADRLLECMNKPYQIANIVIEYVTPSIGISVYPDDAEGVNRLINKADIAMYYAKKDGKNCYRFYDDSMTVE